MWLEVKDTLQKFLVKTTQNFGSKRCNSNNPFFWLIHPQNFVVEMTVKDDGSFTLFFHLFQPQNYGVILTNLSKGYFNFFSVVATIRKW